MRRRIRVYSEISSFGDEGEKLELELGEPQQFHGHGALAHTAFSQFWGLLFGKDGSPF